MHNISQEGRTALHYASYSGHLHVVQALLLYRPNIDVQDNVSAHLYKYIHVYTVSFEVNFRRPFSFPKLCSSSLLFLNAILSVLVPHTHVCKSQGAELTSRYAH